MSDKVEHVTFTACVMDGQVWLLSADVENALRRTADFCAEQVGELDEADELPEEQAREWFAFSAAQMLFEQEADAIAVVAIEMMEDED